MQIVSKVVAVLSVGLLSSAGARADACKKVDAPIATVVNLANCSSPAQFCTTGSIGSGILAGTTHFTVLTAATQGSDFLYTGELVITTRQGTVTVHDAGVLSGTTGQYFEVQQIVSGTGRFAEATGALTSSGFSTGLAFFGTLNGSVCLDGRDGGDRHDKDDAGDDGQESE